MSFQVIFREDCQDFLIPEVVNALRQMEKISDIQTYGERFFLEAIFNGDEESIVIEIQGNHASISNFTSSFDFILFGLELQKKFLHPLRWSDDCLNYDINLLKYQSVAQVRARCMEEDPYDDYPNGSPWDD